MKPRAGEYPHSLVGQPQKANRMKPDVLIVVGGVDFWEHSHHLRYISEYFDAAIGSGMKESREMRFDFPEEDPDEWEFVMSLCVPFATTKIDETNLGIATAWFDKFCVTDGLRACDAFVLDILHGDEFSWIDGFSHLISSEIDTLNIFFGRIERLLNLTTICLQGNLQHSKRKCRRLLINLLGEYPYLLRLKDWKMLCTLLIEYQQFREGELWDSFQNLIPRSIKSNEPDVLLKNESLPRMVYSLVQTQGKRGELRAELFGHHHEHHEDDRGFLQLLWSAMAELPLIHQPILDAGKYHV